MAIRNLPSASVRQERCAVLRGSFVLVAGEMEMTTNMVWMIAILFLIYYRDSRLYY
jgi:hypothetical protein